MQYVSVSMRDSPLSYFEDRKQCHEDQRSKKNRSYDVESHGNCQLHLRENEGCKVIKMEWSEIIYIPWRYDAI